MCSHCKRKLVVLVEAIDDQPAVFLDFFGKSMIHKLALLAALPIVLVHLAIQASTQPSAVKDLARPVYSHQWSFTNGPEFPGADGSVSPSAGTNALDKTLAFKFSCANGACGRYVAAVWRSSATVSLPAQAAITLSICLPESARLGLRVKDAGGQYLQYVVDTPSIEQPDSTHWQRAVIPLWRMPEAHWGGANNGVVNGGISEIWILANARFQPPSQGQVRFRDLSIVSLSNTAFSLDAAATGLATPGPSPLYSPRLGVTIHQTRDTQALDLATEAGFTFVRIDLFWPEVEHAGTFNFTEYDRLQAALEARGLSVLWILGYGHPDHGGKYPQSPEDLKAFSRYAAAAAEHYHGRGASFEIYNEPDLNLPSVTAYEAVLASGLSGIRSQDQSVNVSTGGTSTMNLGFIGSVLESGAAKGVNEVAVHPYRTKPETISNEIGAMRQLALQKLGQPIEIWNTEWGYSSCEGAYPCFPESGNQTSAQERQAVLGIRECLSSWACQMPSIVWYDLRNDGVDPRNREFNYGLITQDGSPKPVLKAISTWVQSLKRHTFAGLLTNLPFGVHAFLLEDTGARLVIVWNTEPDLSRTMKVPRLGLVSVTDLFGQPIHTAAPVLGTVEINLLEGNGPIYLLYKKDH